MASMSSYCRGCRKSFVRTGYWSHLSQSQNPFCRTIMNQQLTAISDSESDNLRPGSPQFLAQDLDEDTPNTFTGDLFGSADKYFNKFGQTNGSNNVNDCCKRQGIRRSDSGPSKVKCNGSPVHLKRF